MTDSEIEATTDSVPFNAGSEEKEEGGATAPMQKPEQALHVE